MTAHRRESFGRGLANIFHALKQLTRENPEIEVVYPVHLNPNVKEPAFKMLGKMERIHLLRPLSYEETFWVMNKCYMILTDSGGIQEEAPSFKKPVLVLRKVTERPEGIQAGVAKLVGDNIQTIVRETNRILKSRSHYLRMCARRNPYGDGHSSERIVDILKRLM